MSAVAGIYCLDERPVDPSVVERMIDELEHRGASGPGVWCEGSVGLGHRAHGSVARASGRSGPLISRDGRRIVTADLRLDNRDELLKQLSIERRPSGEVSDEELILAAHACWGDACPEKLLGDFVFALWDSREQTLFCARDHMGIKPLYYHVSEEVFLFASEIKALLAYPGTPRELNEARVADYLAMNFEDKSHTFYQGIFRLPPGCCMTVDRRGARCRQYWTLDRSLEVRHRTGEEYAEEFHGIFEEAVRCRLRSAAPCGFLLSGGLDSSSIVGLSRRLAGEEGKRLATLSASFADFPQVDEQPYIDLVVDEGGIDASYVRADRIGPLHDIDRVLWAQDEPFHAPNLFVYWALAEAARKRGISVLIDGVDGDTTVGHGLEYLIELTRRGRWIRLLREVAWLSRRFDQPARRFLWHSVFKPAVMDPVFWKASRLLGGGKLSPQSVPATVKQEFARRIGWEERFPVLMKGRSGPVRSFREEHWRTLTSGLIPFYLEVNDKAAAFHGIDHRHPFYDRRLVEYCFAIPPDQKLSRGWDRFVQRRAMKGIVPERIRWRIAKSHWAPNFKRGLFELNRSLVEQVVLKEHPLIAEYIDCVALREAYRRCRSGRISVADGMNIWVAVTLSLWLEQWEKLT